MTYLSLVGVNRIERKLITILILLSLIIYSLLYGSRLDIISDPKLYMHLSSGDKIMIRTKENIPVPKKYVFGNSKDYLYTASEGEKLFEIIFKLGLNPFVLPARLLGVECEIEKDEVHGFLRNISGSIVEIDPKGYTVKTLVGENILLLQELDRDLYYVYFEISGCEPLKWELLNGSLLDIGFNKYIFFNYDH
ncbi:hypothetical protein JXA63_03590 [Candidatus Woesebacteria bacterium]|nr:hypothetical protein [Candidatus Woesebacteria bacterium]